MTVIIYMLVLSMPFLMPFVTNYLEAYLNAHPKPVPHAVQDNKPNEMEEALNILALKANPSENEVKIAHRELMKKNHPDFGGSKYLASKIN
ncbi:MAG: hypothetical protein ABL857_08600, partial [Rickettsiales bacterium]